MIFVSLASFQQSERPSVRIDWPCRLDGYICNIQFLNKLSEENMCICNIGQVEDNSCSFYQWEKEAFKVKSKVPSTSVLNKLPVSIKL